MTKTEFVVDLSDGHLGRVFGIDIPAVMVNWLGLGLSMHHVEAFRQNNEGWVLDRTKDKVTGLSIERVDKLMRVLG